RRALPASSATVARSRTSRPGGSWTWAGKRLTLTDGGGSGQVRLMGSRDLRDLATFPREQLKRVRLVRRAAGDYAHFVLHVAPRIEHAPKGAAVGIGVGIAA